MKKYIKPSIKVITINTCSILAGSDINIGISDTPPTGPAMSKEYNFFDEEDNSSSSIWSD